MFLQRFTLWLIWAYQHTLSPDHGMGRLLFPKFGCKFYPSCSEYARQSVAKLGFGHGVRASIKRLFKCHPWASGGFDPVA